MAIEFSCPHCQHLLRTSDDKAGLSAKCPACSEIIWVPYSTQDPGPASEEQADASDQSPEIGIPLARDPSPDPLDELGSDTTEAAHDDSPAVPRRQSSAEVVCPSCHATNDATASNCRFCGTSLEGVEPAQTSEPPPRTPDVGEALSTAWRVYSENIGLLIGSTLLAIPLGTLAIAVASAPTVGLAAAFGEADDDMAVVGALIGLLCTLPLLLALLVPLAIGVTQLTLKVAAGKNASISDLFYGFEREGRQLILGMALIMIVTFVGNMMIVGTILLWPLGYMYVHERKPIGETFTRFFSVLGAEIAFVVLIGLILYGLNFVVGILIYPCCIGILFLPFVIPFSNVLMAVGYLRLTGKRTAFD